MTLIQRISPGRAVTLVAALAILFWRTPNTFLTPQLWGEDADFLHGALVNGWASVVRPMAGYFVSGQSLIAAVAAYAPVRYAPALYSAAAIGGALLVVAMVASPRFQGPSRYLLALAVVVMPMGNEEIGILANLQWLLPIGVIALLFSRRSPSHLVTAAELAFAAICAVSGPFSIFLAPMAIARAATAQEDRQRLWLLAATVCLGALIQACAVIIYPSPASTIPTVDYPWTVWLNMPLAKFATSLGFKEKVVSGLAPAILSLLLMIGAIWLSFRQPYRALKLAILFFSLAIAFAGMAKFRLDLVSQWGAQRYFYPGCVFLLWFICCIASRRGMQRVAATVVAILEIIALPRIGHTSKMNDDVDQSTWLQFAESGLPVIMPTHPLAWFAPIPAATGRPLAPLKAWTGRNMRDIAPDIASDCSGSMDMIESIAPSNGVSGSPLSKAAGTIAVSGSKAVVAVALIDQSDTVVAFGAPGFPSPDPARLRWQSYFSGTQGAAMSALAVYSDFSTCRIPGARPLSNDVRALASPRFTGAATLLPGRRLVQAFVPEKRLQGMTLQFVTFGQRPDPQTLTWQVRGLFDGDRWVTLGGGAIASARIPDWSTVTLSLDHIPAEVAGRIELSVTTDIPRIDKVPLGIPGYAPDPQSTQRQLPATDGDSPVPGGGQFNLKLYYVD